MGWKLKPRRPQFGLRSLLAAITWTSLVIAICVGQQQAAVRQRETIEELKAAGMLPFTYINGRPVAPTPQLPLVQKYPRRAEALRHAASR